VWITAASTQLFVDSLQRTRDPGHFGLAVFTRRPTTAESERLKAGGLTLFSALHNNAYRVFADKTFRQTDSASRAMLVGLTGLRQQDRVAPDVQHRAYARYLVSRSDAPALNLLLEPDSALRLTISFYPGVADSVIRQLLGSYTRNPRKLGGVSWFAVVPQRNLPALSSADIVYWIDGPPSPIVLDNDHTRADIHVDEVQEFSLTEGKALGLSGQGLQVGVFDAGLDEDHDDFKTFSGGAAIASRVTLTDPAASWHGTLVAGIIAGNGTRSAGVDSRGDANGGTAFQWRGMAPSAELLEVNFPAFALLDPVSGLWTFDRELASKTFRAMIVDHKMDVSNHSYHLLPTMEYGDFSAQRDSMIRGDAVNEGVSIPPRLQVFAAGNNGGWPDASATAASNGYFSLNKDVKNGILVGSWSVANTRIAGSSSLGPTSDGRIKPDLVAPGSQIKSTGYWAPGSDVALLCTALPAGTEAGAPRRQFYGTECGTSLASPVVTGIVALVLEQYAKTYEVDLDVNPPLPSTLRALLIHSADDIANTNWFTSPPPVDGPVRTFTGPDFATGFGKVNAAGATEITARALLRESEITSTCNTKSFNFDVIKEAGSVPDVRVTLAWDDPAADPTEDPSLPRLVNDLDLVVIDPTGARHYPWVRNQVIKGADGSVLAPEQQACNTSIKVETILKSPGPLTDAAIVSASTGVGPDHLNNVEQVLVPGVEGTWRAVVTGFRVDAGPQKFSLVGAPFKIMMVVHPPNLCKKYPPLCRPPVINVCITRPQLCAKPQIIPLFLGGPRITFRDTSDRVIMAVNQLCTYQKVQGGCEADTQKHRYSISVGQTQAPMRVALYSSRGRLLGATTTSRSSRLVFRPVRGEEYFLVTTPSAAVKANQAYDLPMSVKRSR
jgi:subtilisin family serine protease